MVEEGMFLGVSQVGAYLRARDAREYPTGAREYPPALPAELQWRIGTYMTGSYNPNTRLYT